MENIKSNLNDFPLIWGSRAWGPGAVTALAPKNVVERPD